MDTLDSKGANVFWGEIAPCEHILQLYTSNSVFLDTLEGWVSGGLDAGEGIIIIATEENLNALENRLERGKRRIDLAAARSRGQYVTADAEETLSLFMTNGWPDERLFREVVSSLLDRARGYGRNLRRVRAFGEMVAVLWARGHNGATIRLEHLWNSLCRANGFSLFCAYPMIGETQEAHESMKEICAAHSRVIN